MLIHSVYVQDSINFLSILHHSLIFFLWLSSFSLPLLLHPGLPQCDTSLHGTCQHDVPLHRGHFPSLEGDQLMHLLQEPILKVLLSFGGLVQLVNCLLEVLPKSALPGKAGCSQHIHDRNLFWCSDLDVCLFWCCLLPSQFLHHHLFVHLLNYGLQHDSYLLPFWPRTAWHALHD